MADKWKCVGLATAKVYQRPILPSLDVGVDIDTLPKKSIETTLIVLRVIGWFKTERTLRIWYKRFQELKTAIPCIYRVDLGQMAIKKFSFEVQNPSALFCLINLKISCKIKN